GPRCEALSREWRQWLEGVPAVLDLVPFRRDQGPGRRVQRALSVELLTALRALAGAERKTLFTVLAAAWGAVLGWSSGRERLLLGLAVAHRELPEVERVLGFFVNSVALRIDLEGEPTFRALLDRVARATSVALELQALPFEQVVAALAPARNPDRSPLVQVHFAHHPVGSLGVLALRDCTVSGRELDTAPVKFELTLKVEETADGGGRVWAEFHEGRFPPGFVETLLATYEGVLRAAAPEVPVARLMPARTGTERSLARLFAEVLGVEELGPHDDFFQRGGHSLLLLEVVARVRSELARDLSLRDLLELPTVAGVAARLDRAGALR
ncbi:MAG: condensation domain-containing protein, partial [Cystobacter sp.]